MKQFNDDQYCFVCGNKNPVGLKLDFQYNEETGEVTSTANFAKHFQGWENVLHGGLISTVLDEIMIKAAHHKGHKCATVELNVRFKKPAKLEKTFTIMGKVTDVNRRVIKAQGSITDSDNITVATATGKFMTIL
jgi:uncharacterized protein (TIGR00369 family)